MLIVLGCAMIVFGLILLAIANAVFFPATGSRRERFAAIAIGIMIGGGVGLIILPPVIRALGLI